MNSKWNWNNYILVECSKCSIKRSLQLCHLCNLAEIKDIYIYHVLKMINHAAISSSVLTRRANPSRLVKFHLSNLAPHQRLGPCRGAEFADDFHKVRRDSTRFLVVERSSGSALIIILRSCAIASISSVYYLVSWMRDTVCEFVENSKITKNLQSLSCDAVQERACTQATRSHRSTEHDDRTGCLRTGVSG